MFLFFLLGCPTSLLFDFLSVLVVFVFKLLLSFCWLCEEVQCVYLGLHLGSKSVHYLTKVVQASIYRNYKIPVL